MTPEREECKVNVKRLTLSALLLGVALTIFVAEAQLPPPVPIAGVKLGLANIVTLAALVWLGRSEAFSILIMRIFLGSVFAGQAVSFIYSLCGGLLCFLIMAAAISRFGREGLWIVSVMGAVAHNIGQILAAVFMLHSLAVAAYLPVLTASGIITGTFTGLAAQLLTDRVNPKI